MVVFTCNHCGDSLQKPRIEKHYAFVCRNEKSLTCVDCFKDFRDEEYVTHTKCISEEERYAAKGTYANGIVKKGDIKQGTWVEMIKSILDNDCNLKPSCRNLLKAISSYGNIPRKKPKFINFIKSSSGGRANMKDVEEVWNLIEKYNNDKAKTNRKNASSEENLEESQNGASITNGDKNSKNKENEAKKRKKDEYPEESPKKKHKKEKEVEENVTEPSIHEVSLKKKKKQTETEKETLDIQNEESVQEKSEFNFQDKILEIVSVKQSISLKKLQRKVLNAYLKKTGEVEVTAKILKKFNKKLKKVPNLEVDQDTVTLSIKNQ